MTRAHLRLAFEKFQADQCQRLAAALAYYAVFSMSPLVFLMVAIGGILFSPEAASGEVIQRTRQLIGSEAATYIQGLMERQSVRGGGTTAAVVGVLVLLYGASQVFNELQAALSVIWVVPRRCRGCLKDFLRDELLALLLVFGSVGLLLVSLTASVLLAALNPALPGGLPGPGGLAQTGGFLFNLVLATLFLTILFRWLSEGRISWRAALRGAAVTSVFLAIGHFLIAFYLRTFASTSAYGAAGTLVGILTWFYYSALILLFGAELSLALMQASTRARSDELLDARATAGSIADPRSFNPH